VRDDWTIVEAVLAELPRPNSDGARAERVRARCHKALSRSKRPSVQPPPLRRAIESAVVGGFCAVYLCVLVLVALHTHGVL
jgi:hypothetical protein